MSKHHGITTQVREYYEEKLRQYGPTARGVDWNSDSSQTLRFQQLTSVLEQAGEHFSILDYGCGYGALYDYMSSRYHEFTYIGFDISQEMLRQAVQSHRDPENGVTWIHDMSEITEVDFVIASGIFNVKLAFPDDQWQAYILDTLHRFSAWCVRGFAFNILTAYSDREYMKPNLYYADPCDYFDYCKRNFSPRVALLHDYPLYEFTMIVRKERRD